MPDYRKFHLWFFLSAVLLATTPVHARETILPAVVHEQALAKIHAGDVTGGASDLLVALRAWPDDSAAIDSAFRSAYLLKFVIECLMSDRLRRSFMNNEMQSGKEPLDDLLQCVLNLSSDGNMTQEQANSIARKVQSLVNNRKPVVRVLSLALFSSPYYYRDSVIARNARGELLEQFPDLELTKSCVRSIAYRKRDLLATNPTALGAILANETAASAHPSDPVLGVVTTALKRISDGGQNSLPGSPTPDTLLAQSLAATAVESQDAQTRVGCLYLMEGLARHGHAEEFKQAASAIARRPTPGGDVTFARIELLRLAKNGRDKVEIRRQIEALMKLDDPGVIYFRNLFEDVMKDVDQGIEALMNQGEFAGAAAYWDALAAKFPNSALNLHCTAMAAVSRSKIGATRRGQTESSGAAWQSRSNETTRMLDQIRVTLRDYVRQGSKQDEVKCTELVDQLLARGDLTPEDLIAAAQAARVLKQWPKALAAIERRLAKYPDATFPPLITRGEIAGQFWIAAIAREGGDVQRACAAYDRILQDVASQSDRDSDFVRIEVALRKADLMAIAGNPERAKEILKARPARPTNERALELVLDDWAVYYLDNLEKGGPASRNTVKRTVYLGNNIGLLLDILLAREGCGVDIPLKYDPRSDAPSCMDRAQSASTIRSIMADVATIHLGVWYQSERTQDIEKAKRYLRAVSQGDSFLAPEAGLALLRCATNELKESKITTDTRALVQELKTRFPGYAPAIDEHIRKLSAMK